MGIVDDLVQNAGLYIGVDRVQGSDAVGSARMVVTALPGDAGVALDYEVLNPSRPGPVRGHVEHTVVARAHGGGTIMLVADTHAGAAVTLHETEPGVFEPGPEGSPYPMKVVLAVPKPGVLHHHWWYGRPGDAAQPRDLAELERVG
jgi:hypothetical protein